MQIIEKSIKEIKPYEKNPRRNDKAVDAVAASISEFGFKVPIVIDKNGVIVCGHTRYKAAKKLKLPAVPCIMADDLTDAQVKAFRLADNKTAELSDWDYELLDAELLDAELLDFDMDDFGFGDKETAKEKQRPEVQEIEEVEAGEEIDAETRVKTGDVWRLGRHLLFCGDATMIKESESFKEQTADADSWFIDPPYDLEELYSTIPPQKDGQKLFVSYSHKHFQAAILEASKKGWQGQYEFIWNCIQTWYTPNRPLARHKTVALFMDSADWDFQAATIKDDKERHPVVSSNARGAINYVPLDGGHYFKTIEDFSNTAMSNEDVGQAKPLRWIAAMLNGARSKKVVDLFAGSGTVLIACEQTNKTCVSVEIEPSRCDVILKRYEFLTGKEGERIRANERREFDSE